MWRCVAIPPSLVLPDRWSRRRLGTTTQAGGRRAAAAAVTAAGFRLRRASAGRQAGGRRAAAAAVSAAGLRPGPRLRRVAGPPSLRTSPSGRDEGQEQALLHPLRAYAISITAICHSRRRRSNSRQCRTGKEGNMSQPGGSGPLVQGEQPFLQVSRSPRRCVCPPSLLHSRGPSQAAKVP